MNVKNGKMYFCMKTDYLQTCFISQEKKNGKSYIKLINYMS